MYEELYSLTDGAVTPLIGQVLVDAGYDTTYSFKGKPLQPAPRWEDVMSYQFPILTLKKAALLDLGAIGKGYLIDIIAECLEAAGITAYLIDAGGDMKHHDDSAPAQIGLEHPLKRDEVIGTLQLQNQSLCGSAGNRRAWGNYHHIMDPTSLLPANNILAVWVIADTTLLADALATSLFFISPKLLQKQYTFAYAIVHADQSLERSTDFPAHFF
jgi:thiamine biosynthesis lipoprotein